MDHYSSNPASIWSSATMNTNLTSSMGRPTAAAAAHAQRAASQGTLFDAPSSVEPPAHNALVIEKGMLRLCPPKRHGGGKGGARAADPAAADGAERGQEQKERLPVETLELFQRAKSLCIWRVRQPMRE